MKNYLLRLARWIELRYLDDGVYYVVCTPAIVSRAIELVQEQEPLPQSGEWKRHQVYSALLKEFPTTSKRTLAMAIELALR